MGIEIFILYLTRCHILTIIVFSSLLICFIMCILYLWGLKFSFKSDKGPFTYYVSKIWEILKIFYPLPPLRQQVYTRLYCRNYISVSNFKPPPSTLMLIADVICGRSLRCLNDNNCFYPILCKNFNIFNLLIQYIIYFIHN